MRRLFALGFVALFFLTGRDPAHSADYSEYFPNGTPDGRFGTACHFDVCEVPLSRLIALPERFHGKVVKVRGFLVVPDSPTLYLSRDIAERRFPYEGVAVDGRIDPAIRAKLERGAWVTVTGEFDGVSSGWVLDLGVIRKSEVQEIPLYRDLTAKPSPPKVRLISPDKPKVIWPKLH